MSNHLKETKQLVTRMASQFAAALPQQVPSKKYVRTLQTAISNPMIADKINTGKLNQTSLMDAAMKCASDGLLMDGREAALLTFYNKETKKHDAQYIPMVGGLMKKARNSGDIKSIIAKVVYDGDEFEQWVDEHGEHFKHKPVSNSLERGDPIKVYALGITKDGGTQLEVLERADIDAIAKHSKNSFQYDPKKGPWFGEWWKKAAIRRVCKYLPSSAELDNLFEHDNENFDVDEDLHQEPERQSAKDINADLGGEGVIEGETVTETPEDVI